jgi:capsular polysaccharide biosynthesis protein
MAPAKARAMPTGLVPAWAPTSDAGGNAGVERVRLYPASTVNTDESLVSVAVQPGVSDPVEEFRRLRGADREYVLPARELLILRPAWVESVMCVAITSSGEYIAETLRKQSQAREQGYEFPVPGELDVELPERSAASIEGRAILAGLPTGGNYFHWQFEAVARALLARKVAPPDAKLLVPKLGTMERAALDAAGIALDDVIELAPLTMVRVDELYIAPRGLRGSAVVLPEAVDALRSLAKKPHSERRRIYISRAGASRRRIHGEAALVKMLERHAFEGVQPESLDVRGQIDLFASAEAIVGLHGGGLTNIAFAPKGAIIVELQPTRLDLARTVLYRNVSSVAGHRHAQVVCPPAHPATSDDPAWLTDIRVDVSHLDRLLERLLSLL